MRNFILMLMVFMIACVVPTMAIADYNISEKGSLIAALSQDNLVVSPAAMDQGTVLVVCAINTTKLYTDIDIVFAVDAKSPEVAFLPCSKPVALLSPYKINYTNTVTQSIYNPGHEQFDYGPGATFDFRA